MMSDRTCLKCGLPMEIMGCIRSNEIGRVVKNVSGRCRYCGFSMGFSIGLPMKVI